MKILWRGYLGQNHSWSLVAQNISRSLIEKGHDIHLFSTNGIKYFPNDLLPNLKGYIEDNTVITAETYKTLVADKLDQNYSCQLSYTALKNFANYFSHGTKNRFGIWNYETTVIPQAFIKYHKCVDKVLPSSQFSKKIFTDNGMPESKQVVIPHGVNLKNFENLEKYPIKTDKKYKILCNIAQPHLRKNIPGLLKAWGMAFTAKDDVSLILKISKKGANGQGDVDFNGIFKDFKSKFKNHAEIKIIDTFIENMVPLYNAVDVVMTMSLAECYWLPGIESFAANKITIAPRYGGQLDFMNDNNSILIEGKEIKADYAMQYWEPSPYAKVFQPNPNDCADKLRNIISNYDDYLTKFSPGMKEKLKEHNWSNVADQILNLCE